MSVNVRCSAKMAQIDEFLKQALSGISNSASGKDAQTSSGASHAKSDVTSVTVSDICDSPDSDDSLSTAANLVKNLVNKEINSAKSHCEKRPIPEDLKDTRYFERRKRNNLAAKKSRDLRKKREDGVALKAANLEKENAILRAQVSTLREEMSSLQAILIQKQLSKQRRLLSQEILKKILANVK